MPLDGQDKMIQGFAFQCLDDAVVGTARNDAQALSRNVYGLMVAGVNWQATQLCADLLEDAGKTGYGIYFHHVRYGDLAPRLMIYCRFDVLYQRTIAMDVQALLAIADT